MLLQINESHKKVVAMIHNHEVPGSCPGLAT